jgi:hypothetical protein
LGLHRRALLLITLVLLSACGAPVLKKDQADTFKRVGIVSLLPDQMTYHKVGITAFNNELITKPVGSLLNGSAQDAAAGEIVKTAGRNVKVIAVDISSLAKRYRSGAIVMSWDVERIKSDLVELIRKNNLDAIVVVAERYDSGNGVDGVKVYFVAGLSDIRAVSIRTGMTISVLNATGEVIGISNVGGRYSSTRPVSKPNGAWSYKLDENLDQDTQQFLVRATQQAIAADVQSSLNQLGF